jgi:hypothetical protein
MGKEIIKVDPSSVEVVAPNADLFSNFGQKATVEANKPIIKVDPSSVEVVNDYSNNKEILTPDEMLNRTGLSVGEKLLNFITSTDTYKNIFENPNDIQKKKLEQQSLVTIPKLGTNKETQDTPSLNYLKVKAKDFGAVENSNGEIDLDNIGNQYALQKAADYTGTLDLKIKNGELSDGEIADMAANEVNRQKSKLQQYQDYSNMYKGIETINYDNKNKELKKENPIEYLQGNREINDALFTKNIENINNTQKELQDSKQYFQQLRKINEDLKFNNVFEDPKNQLGLITRPTNIDADEFITNGIKLASTGDLLYERARLDNAFEKVEKRDYLPKLEGPVEYEYKMPELERQNYLNIGAKQKIEQLNLIIAQTQEQNKQLTEYQNKLNEQIGNRQPTPEAQKALDSIKSQKQALLDKELNATKYRDKVIDIKKTNSGLLDKQENIINTWENAIKSSPIISTVAQLGRVVEDLAIKDVAVAIPGILERVANHIQANSDDGFGISKLEEVKRNLEFEGDVDQNLLNIGYTRDLPYLNENSLLDVKDGKFVFNLRLLPYTIAKTTGESLLLATGALLTEGLAIPSILLKPTQLASMVATSDLFLGEESIRQLEKQGISPNTAYWLGHIYAMAEGFTEAWWLPELKALNKFVEKEGVELTKEKAAELAIGEFAKKLEIPEAKGFIGRLYNITKDWTQNFGSKKLALKEIGKLYTEYTAEEYGENLGNDIINTFANKVAENFDQNFQSPDSQLTIKDQLASLFITAVSMVPTQYIGARNEFNRMKQTANYYVGENPEYYNQWVKDQYKAGKLTKEQAIKADVAIQVNTGANTLLKPAFDAIDNNKNLTKDQKDEYKITLHNTELKIQDLQKELLKNLTDEQKETIIQDIEKETENKVEIINEANSATPKNLQEQVKKYDEATLNTELSENKIKEFSKQKAQDIKSTLEAAIPSIPDNLKPLYQNKIDELQKHIETPESKEEKIDSIENQIDEEIKNSETSLNKLDLINSKLSDLEAKGAFRVDHPNTQEKDDYKILTSLKEKLEKENKKVDEQNPPQTFTFKEVKDKNGEQVSVEKQANVGDTIELKDGLDYKITGIAPNGNIALEFTDANNVLRTTSIGNNEEVLKVVTPEQLAIHLKNKKNKQEPVTKVEIVTETTPIQEVIIPDTKLSPAFTVEEQVEAKKTHALRSLHDNQMETSDEPFYRRERNTLSRLVKLQKDSGKSFLQLGYTATLVKGLDRIPIEYFSEQAKAYYEKNPQAFHDGWNVVITDNKGEIIYFDEQGKITTKELGGQPVFQKFIKNVNKTSNNKFDKDLQERVNTIRNNGVDVTFELEYIVNTVQEKAKEIFANESFSPEEIADSKFVFNNVTGACSIEVKGLPSMAMTPTKVSDFPEIQNFIEAFLNLENKEGLPSNLQSYGQRTAYLEKMFATSAESFRFRKYDTAPNQIVLTNKQKIENQYFNIAKESSNFFYNEEFSTYLWDGQKFTPVTYPTYKNFVAQVFKIKDNILLPKSMVLGDPIIVKSSNKGIQDNEEQQSNVEETTPKEEPKISSKNKFKVKTDTLDDLDQELYRSHELNHLVSEEQKRKAQEWFDKYAKKSGITLENLTHIFNSKGRASWINGAIKLWQGGISTDLYHEAFHDFSQLYLTPKQKAALYDEVRKELNKPDISDKEAEEILAEDFMKYMLSEQKLILNKRPVRNSLFRKIYNFLKEFFTGVPSIQSAYRQLATLNLRDRNVDNIVFGELNRNIENFDFSDSYLIRDALDSLIADIIRDRRLSITSIFENAQNIKKTYNQVYNTLVNSYSALNDIIENPESTETEKFNAQVNLDRLDKVLSDWDKVIENHRKYSTYFKLGKEVLPQLEDSEENSLEKEAEKKDWENDDESISSKDRTSKEILYLIASLPEYEFKNGIWQIAKNEYLGNVNKTMPLTRAWDVLAKNLQGSNSYDEMYLKIQAIAKNSPSFDHLLLSIPSPTQPLTLSTQRLKAQFVNAFSQPLVPLVSVNFVYDADGKLSIYSKPAFSKITNDVKRDWTLTLPDSPYYNHETNSLELNKLLSKFNSIGANGATKNQRESFLKAIGINFSETTKNTSPEYQQLINGENNTILKIYNALKQYKELQAGNYPNNLFPTSNQIESINTPIDDVIKILSKSIYSRNSDGGNSPLFLAPKEQIDSLIDIEINSSDKYFSDNVLNSQGDNVYAIRQWSAQSKIVALLNDENTYPTYQSLINTTLGSYFDVNKNPDANNIFINSLFDLNPESPEYGQRRTDRNGVIKIQIYNHDGLVIDSDNIKDGKKTIGLTEFEKFVQDISSFLLTGHKENIRHGDKTTARGILTNYVAYGSKSTKFLPVDVYDFKDGYVSEQTYRVLLPAMETALQYTNDFYVNSIGKDYSNFNKSLTKDLFGSFDKVFSKETKDKILEAGLKDKEDFNPKKVIESLKKDIQKDISNYFQKITEEFKKELESYNFDPEEIIADNLLQKFNYETILRGYVINSWITNLEYTRLFFQDARYYKNKDAYKEPFKRYSKTISTGGVFINDAQTNSFLNHLGNSEALLYFNEHPELPVPNMDENGVINSVIFEDVKTNAKDYAEKLADKTDNIAEKMAILKAYSDGDVSDAQGFITFDGYRKLSIRLGAETWNKDKEDIYQKIINGELLTPEERLSSYNFFPSLKLRYTGQIFDNKNQRWIPADYKFAITPLLPNAIQGTEFEKVRNKMLESNTVLGLFGSASKHSALLNDKGEFNTFESNWTQNPINVEYLFEVVKTQEDYKNKVTFPTQKRKLLFVNQFNNGVPVDYKGSEWNNLSEKEKKEQSKMYNLEQKYGDLIDRYAQIETNTLLDEIFENNKFDVVKFSQLLQNEFEKRNVSQNLFESIQTVLDAFKNPLDASIGRDAIENIILSIIHNRIVKQQVNGESLVQVSSVGWDDSLKNYEPNGRTLPDGTKVTSAAQCKIPLNSNFELLLDIPEVQKLSKDENITVLQALNKLIQNEEWLNEGENRKLITIISDRIPIQGLNSMEFFEVKEFLPPSVGNIIVVNPLIVAKSGGDFDYDKLYTLYPYISKDKDGKIVPTNQKNAQETKLLESIFGKSVYDSKDKKPIINELINITRQVLESEHSFSSLTTPNSTYMFEPIADEIKDARNPEKAGISDLYSPLESVKQFASNTVGKGTLGIGAILNVFLPLMQKSGMYLNPTYKSTIKAKIEKSTNNRLKHNTIGENISISGIYDANKQYKISEAISQLMNGWVDVAKKDWIFYLNGNREMSSAMITALMQGTPKDDVIALFTQPIVNEYIKLAAKYKSAIFKANTEIRENIKEKILSQLLIKYLGQEEFDKNFDHNFWKDLNKYSNKVDGTYFGSKFMSKYSIPNNGTVVIPTTQEDKKAQVAYLMQVLDFMSQAQVVSAFRRTINQDTEKPTSLQAATDRNKRVEQLKFYNLFPTDLVDKVANESVLRGFTSKTTGIDSTIKKFSDNVFEVTNSKLFNDFLIDIFEKENLIPFENKYQIKDAWVKQIKSDFILYLYQNYIYNEQGDVLISEQVFNQMKYNTALAIELEEIKKKFPNELKNNILLNSLVRDNGKINRYSKKPNIVSIKLKLDNIDTNMSNTLTESFKKLLNSPIPEIQEFAQKLAHFAFVQSGLSKTPVSFANIIPQENYAKDMGKIIHAFKELIKTHPENAKIEFNKFYHRFKENNLKFYENYELDESTEDFPVYAINPRDETFRKKNYIINNALDIFDKRKNKVQKLFENKIKEIHSKTEIDENYSEKSAKDNPKTLFIFEDNEKHSGFPVNSSAIIVKNGKQRNDYPNTYGFPLYSTFNKYWSDDNYLENIAKIDTSIKEIKNQWANGDYTQIKFPKEFNIESKLENAPKTYVYLLSQLKENFNINLGNSTENSNSEDLNNDQKDTDTFCI